MKQSFSLFLLSALALFCFSCNNADKKTTTTSSPEKITVSNQGVAIDFTDTGKGDTVLLFVHGWCINKSYWSEQESFFKDRYRIVTMDLPGFGKSGKNRNDWSTQMYGRDVDSVMEKLNLKNVILVGHSMSGDIVLEAAVHSQERVIGLVGVDNFKSVAQANDSATKKNIESAKVEMRKDFKQVVGGYFKEYLFSKSTDSLIKNRILDDVFHCDSLIAIESIGPNDFNEVEKLKTAKKKLYLINSDNFPTDTTGFHTNNLPYEILYTPGAGHYSMVENPRLFNTHMQKIIREVGKGDY